MDHLLGIDDDGLLFIGQLGQKMPLDRALVNTRSTFWDRPVQTSIVKDAWNTTAIPDRIQPNRLTPGLLHRPPLGNGMDARSTI